MNTSETEYLRKKEACQKKVKADIDLLEMYFPTLESIELFNRVLKACYLLDKEGFLKARKTLELKEVLRAGCNGGIIAENWENLLNHKKAKGFVRNISEAYGIKDLNKRTLINAFEKEDTDTYIHALSIFMDSSP